jgi:hypothetical protein
VLVAHYLQTVAAKSRVSWHIAQAVCSNINRLVQRRSRHWLSLIHTFSRHCMFSYIHCLAHYAHTALGAQTDESGCPPGSHSFQQRPCDCPELPRRQQFTDGDNCVAAGTLTVPSATLKYAPPEVVLAQEHRREVKVHPSQVCLWKLDRVSVGGLDTYNSIVARYGQAWTRLRMQCCTTKVFFHLWPAEHRHRQGSCVPCVHLARVPSTWTSMPVQWARIPHTCMLLMPHASVKGRAPCPAWMCRSTYCPDPRHVLMIAQDIWALGVIGFEALTGSPALPCLHRTADAIKLADGRLQYEWEGSNVAPAVVQSRAYPIVRACLQRDQAHRTTAAGILQAIRALGFTATPTLRQEL